MYWHGQHADPVSVYGGIAALLMQAANDLHVHPGWAGPVHRCTTRPNLIHRFWMLLLLGVPGLRVRDVLGYTLHATAGPRAAGAGLPWLLGPHPHLRAVG